MLVQILQQGLDAGQKRALYSALSCKLQRECSVPEADLILTFKKDAVEEWGLDHEASVIYSTTTAL